MPEAETKRSRRSCTLILAQRERDICPHRETNIKNGGRPELLVGAGQCETRLSAPKFNIVGSRGHVIYV